MLVLDYFLQSGFFADLKQLTLLFSPSDRADWGVLFLMSFSKTGTSWLIWQVTSSQMRSTRSSSSWTLRFSPSKRGCLAKGDANIKFSRIAREGTSISAAMWGFPQDLNFSEMQRWTLSSSWLKATASAFISSLRSLTILSCQISFILMQVLRCSQKHWMREARGEKSRSRRSRCWAVQWPTSRHCWTTVGIFSAKAFTSWRRRSPAWLRGRTRCLRCWLVLYMQLAQRTFRQMVQQTDRTMLWARHRWAYDSFMKDYFRAMGYSTTREKSSPQAAIHSNQGGRACLGLGRWWFRLEVGVLLMGGQGQSRTNATNQIYSFPQMQTYKTPPKKGKYCKNPTLLPPAR